MTETGNILESDLVICDLRRQVDAMDTFRAKNVAVWIGATILKLDTIDPDQGMTDEEKRNHWEPFRTIEILTVKRDELTDGIGLRKKALEEEYGKSVPVNQEGRWNLVKGTYVAAIEEECRRRNFDPEQSERARQWMDAYAESEHARSKERQENLRINADAERQSA